jgi:hypothetical protein
MHGFDLKLLANEKTEKGWFDPITSDTIPTDQISSSRILRFEHYALPLQTALHSMLTRDYKKKDCPLGEIPHPLEARQLATEDKERFLSEVSALLAIDSQELALCWQIEVGVEDAATFIPQIKNWDYASDQAQWEAMTDLMTQILHRERKLAFLSLLTDSTEKTYFDDDFLPTDVKIPDLSFPPITQEQFHQALAGIGIIY